MNLKMLDAGHGTVVNVEVGVGNGIVDGIEGHGRGRCGFLGRFHAGRLGCLARRQPAWRRESVGNARKGRPGRQGVEVVPSKTGGPCECSSASRLGPWFTRRRKGSAGLRQDFRSAMHHLPACPPPFAARTFTTLW